MIDPKQQPSPDIPRGQDCVGADDDDVSVVSPFYTPAEVATLFRRTTRTIRAWSVEGRLRRVKIAGATYYRRAEIDVMLANGGVNICDESET